MLRYWPVVLVGALSATAAFAAGVAAELPAIVEFVFITCLALFFAAVLTDITTTTSKESDHADSAL